MISKARLLMLGNWRVESAQSCRILACLGPAAQRPVSAKRPKQVGSSRSAVRVQQFDRRGGTGCGSKKVVKRRRRVPLERDDHLLLSFCQDRGSQFRRTGLHILDRRPLPSLRLWFSSFEKINRPAGRRELTATHLYVFGVSAGPDGGQLVRPICEKHHKTAASERSLPLKVFP